MATLSQSEYDRLLKQIQDAQKQVNTISSQVNKPAPTGQVLGASSNGPLNAAQMGGASGLGFENEPTQGVVSGQVQATTNAGGSKSQAGDSVSSSQANSLVKGYGLEGLFNAKSLEGKTIGEASQIIQREKAKRTGQITSNTTFAFNPETISGAKKIVDRVGIGINDITNDAFSSKGTQQDKIKATLEASAREIASLFNSQEEYNNAVSSNTQLQQTLDTFQKLGGDIGNISNKIASPVVDNQPKTTSEYLANLSNPQANQQAEQKAMDELIPERAIIQDEIARQQNIPAEFKDLYFGTEEQVGLLELKKNQALEEKRIIEQKEKNDQITLKAKAQLAIEKNDAERRVQVSQIEENRLAAKNYMTGMLAKLGALKTTGVAPMALQTLDTKYQIQTQTLENKYKYDEQSIKIQLDDALNNVETDTDEQILKLEQDLTKDYEDITKEILKLQQSADRETFNLTNKYATLLRTRTTAYTKELKAEAEKYAKAFAKTASGGIDLFSLAKTTNGTLGRASKKTPLSSSYSTVKADIKKNLPPEISTRIINELTDEQMSLFLEDYLAQRTSRQQSFNPTGFFEQWKKTNEIVKKKTSSSLEDKLNEAFGED